MRGSVITAVLLAVFGMVTVVASGAVLFNFGAAQTLAGAVVPIVLWMNFFAGFLYLLAAFGLFTLRPWAATPLLIAAALLVVAWVGFFAHIQLGGAYEPRTVGALAFRLFVTLLFFFVVRYFVRRFKPENTSIPK